MGLFELLGYEKVDVLYPPFYAYPGGLTGADRNAELWGLGFGYAQRLPVEALAAQRSKEDILMDLRKGLYEVVIWGGGKRSLIHLDDKFVVSLYSNQPHRLWICDGEDSFDGWTYSSWGPWDSIIKNTTVFVRELLDVNRN
jgi:hypothetical protein